MIININGGNGGGGGGSYTLPIASASVLGGVKVGSGLTIDNAGRLSTSGGSGNSNYAIVDALSAITNPTEGLMAYVKSGAKVISGIRVQISDFEAFTQNTDGRAEDYLARIHWGDWDENAQSEDELNPANIYLSGNQFYWDWNNDGNLNYREFERDGVNYKIMYRTHNGEESGYGSYFDFYPIDTTPWGDFIIALNSNCSTAVTQQTEIIPGRTYVYNAGQWVEIASTTFVWEKVAPSTTAETAAIVAEIRADIARGIYPSIFYQSHIFTYSGDGGDWVNFEGVFGENRSVTFYISDKIFDDNGFNSYGIRVDNNEFVSQHYQYGIEMTSAGTFTDAGVLGKFSEESHMDEIVFKINGDNGDWSQAPLKYVWRKYEQIDGEDKLVYYWAVEIIVNGVPYKGAWHAVEDDWGNYVTDTWAAVS